jgi:hypothetical protein
MYSPDMRTNFRHIPFLILILLNEDLGRRHPSAKIFQRIWHIIKLYLSSVEATVLLYETRVRMDYYNVSEMLQAVVTPRRQVQLILF